VDYNIFGSKYAFLNDAQGGAYVNNLFAGKIVLWNSKDRSTPYHTPHSTDIIGCSSTYGGDDRYYQNIFIGGQTTDIVGTSPYGDRATSLQEYIDDVDAYPHCDHLAFFEIKQPVYIAGNVYLNGAKPFEKETNKLDCDKFDAGFAIEKDGNEVYLIITMPDGFELSAGIQHDTKSLGRVRIADADFENPDGSHLTLDCDYCDKPVGNNPFPGPLNHLKVGKNRIKIWG